MVVRRFLTARRLRDLAAAVRKGFRVASDKPLQSAARPSFDVESHRLDRLPFARAQLAYHVIEEMGARLSPGKTVMKVGLELPEFLQEPFYIRRGQVKGGNRKASASGPTGW